MRKVVLAIVLVLFVMAMVVPVVSAAPPASGYWYIVRKGDTLSGIAYSHGVKLSQLIYANGIKNPDFIYYGQKLWIPPKSYGYKNDPYGKRVHNVKYGETLIGIGAAYGVNPWAIAKANGIYNLNRIFAGQRLYIPYGY